MSTFPKPRRKGWRFLRRGEKLRKTDRYEDGDGDESLLNAAVDFSDLDAYGHRTVGVGGPWVCSSGKYNGYIRRIVKRKKKK